MSATQRPLIVGNWKMNGTRASVDEFTRIIAGSAELRSRIDVVVCPPATLIMRFVEAAGGAIIIGGQDCLPSRAAPSRATFPPRCSPISAPAQ